MAKATKNAAKIIKAANAKETPYREGSNYQAIVTAVTSLGLGKMHPLDTIVKAVKSEMGRNGIKDFDSKKIRNKETHQDLAGRIVTNCSVLKRPDYGARLRAFGMEMRFDGRAKEAGIFRLTAASKPQPKAKAAKGTKAKPKKAA